MEQKSDLHTPKSVTKTTTEEQGIINGVPFVHRRTETVPVASELSPETLNPLPTTTTTESVHREEAAPNTVSTWRDLVPSGISNKVNSLVTRLGQLTMTTPKERWSAKIVAKYENEKDEEVEDTIELEFGSKGSAENYVEQWKAEIGPTMRVHEIIVRKVDNLDSPKDTKKKAETPTKSSDANDEIPLD